MSNLVITVFLFQDPCQTGFSSLIEELDQQGAKIELFTEMDKDEDYSNYIISYYDELKSKECINSKYYFATDKKELKTWFQDEMSEEVEGIIFYNEDEIKGISTYDGTLIDIMKIASVNENKLFVDESNIQSLPLEEELAVKLIANLKSLDEAPEECSLVRYGMQLDEAIKQLNKEEKETLKEFLMDWYKRSKHMLSLQQSIFILHYLCFRFVCVYFLEEFMKLVYESKSLTFGQRYFIWTQTRRLGLMHPDMMTPKISEYRTSIYKQQVKQAQKIFTKDAKRIPVEERNPNLVVVFCNIIVTQRHAPTHTALERCYHIAKSTGKQVILINTNEYTAFYDTVPLYDNIYGNDNRIMVNKGIRYKDLRFAYFELGKVQSREDIREVQAFIQREKPLFAFQIGGASLIADLCSVYIPTVVMGVAFSKLPTTCGGISVLGRGINKEEWPKFNLMGYDKDNLLDSTFTFELQEQKKTFTKEEYGIPNDKFILCVVGIRLDYEVTEEFLEMLEKTYPYGTHVVFVGVFENYKNLCKENEQLRQHSTFFGFCNDMLAFMELCDLYVNPIRLGGGFSIVEAFAKGVPGVTTNTGDVSISSGPDFWVNNYDEMAVTILKYVNDKEFYKSMVEKAGERLKVVTDGPRAMKELIQKLESSKYFK